MDQVKIGSFLKELRKEKALTQEQIAERFGVSARTVSRWETGRNMPDISILIELADFYDIDIRELIDGERKSESMDKEMKQTLVKVSEYTAAEKAKMTRDILTNAIMSILCGIAALVSLALADMGKSTTSLSIIFVSVILGSLTSITLDVLRINESMSKNKAAKVNKALIIGAVVIMVICIAVIVLCDIGVIDA